MGLTQFRRRFQGLDPLLTKNRLLVTEGTDERKVCGAGAREGWALDASVPRGLPQWPSAPAGIWEPGLGAEMRVM